MAPKASNLFGCAGHLIPLILAFSHPPFAKATEDKPGEGTPGRRAVIRYVIEFMVGSTLYPHSGSLSQLRYSETRSHSGSG